MQAQGTMRDILLPLAVDDYRFLVSVLRGSRRRTMESYLDAIERTNDEDAREELCGAIEDELRFLGSSKVSYQARKAVGITPGASLTSIIRDAADVLKIPPRRDATDREMLSGLVEDYATWEFGRLEPKDQQQMLENLGIERKRAVAFLKRTAGIFALPIMVDAFGIIVVQGLVKTVIFGIIARIIGQKLAMSLLAFLFSKVPWWVGWVSPGAWALSIGWTALTLQGPTRRKTVPIVLYLGLCCMRQDAATKALGGDGAPKCPFAVPARAKNGAAELS